MKVCIDCGIPASKETHYTPASWGGRFGSRCKECDKAKAIRWRNDNPKRFRKNQRANHLKRRYGLTEEGWDTLFEKQGARCAICGSAETGGNNGWHTDHCHKSGRVRGILCHACNTAYTVHVEENMEKFYEYHKRALEFLNNDMHIPAAGYGMGEF